MNAGTGYRGVAAAAVLLLCGLPFSTGCVPAREGGSAAQQQRVYLIKDYRYLPGVPAGDSEIGHSLCSTRCNALSTDYLNYIEPGGWSMTKVGTDREIRVPLDNPFLGGECLCLADVYLVKIDDLNCPDNWSPVSR